MLIAPTEPPPLKSLGKVSLVPESYGVDILFATPRGLCGLQRKELTDYIASVRDGRLGKELSQMRQLAWKGLVLEGVPKWTNDGRLMNGWTDWSRAQHISSLVSMQDSNVCLLPTDSLSDTVTAVQKIISWLSKDNHSSFLNRSKPTGDKWGRVTNRDWALHLLQSFDGISLTLASRILDHFGKVPLRWTVSTNDLSAVHGLGPKRIKALLQSLETDEQ